jgi:hypothetical protein
LLEVASMSARSACVCPRPLLVLPAWLQYSADGIWVDLIGLVP